MVPLKIAVIIGSTRPNRFGDKPGKWIYEEAKKVEGVEVELLDLVDYPMPFYEEPMGPSMLNKKYSNDVVKKFSAKVDAADAFIIVTPEYNHSTSGVLKNALDHLFPEWNNKPVGFVSYGGVGGARAVEHLRQISVELEMAPIRNAVHIPGNILFPIIMGQAQWTAETEAGLMDNAHKMLTQLVWWGNALKAARNQQAQ
ncbi:MAG: NADPH-dependent reductase [Candidatus Peribacteria bacterium]|nr:NADPH-dependent reductase [Candidatus Peribacteria bacterium]